MVYYFKNPRTGYGWLGYRAAETFPEELNEVVDLVVATPQDAFYLFPELERSERKKVVLCAVDGTDFPHSWQPYLSRFDGMVVMLDHSNFAERYSFVLGQWYPKLRFWGKSGEWKPRERVAGTIAQQHGRKNFNLLPYILAGAPEWNIEVITDKHTASYLTGLQSSFSNLQIITNDLTDDELMDWYLSLRVFFSLSGAEGGGLPAYEAAYLGVPTLLPNHTAYKFVPNATFYPCFAVPATHLQVGGTFYMPHIESFIDILRNEKIPAEQKPAPPPFPIEPDWRVILAPFLQQFG